METNLIAPKYTMPSFVLTVLTVMYLILPVSAVAQTTYTVTDLGTLGGPFGVAHGIDASGQVSGFALRSDSLQHAFLRRKGATTNLDLGTLGGSNVLNSDSSFRSSETQVAGGSDIATPNPLGVPGLTGGTFITRAYLWRNGTMTDLGTLGGYDSYANGINARGQVVGWATIANLDPTCPPGLLPFSVQQSPPALWENGKVQALPRLDGDLSGFALSINNNGDAVGFSTPGFCSPVQHAVRWHNGTVTPLGSLGGNSNNWALNSNDLGQVVGFSDVTGDTTNHAFLWQNGLMTDLGTLDVSSFAPAINNRGEVVGASCDQNNNCRAVLWQNGSITDLNTLIPADSPLYLLQALDINSFGQIVGCAFQFSSGEVHAFLLDPVPGASGAGPRLAAPGEGPRVALPDGIREKLVDSVIPGAGRFRLRMTQPK